MTGIIIIIAIVKITIITKVIICCLLILAGEHLKWKDTMERPSNVVFLRSLWRANTRMAALLTDLLSDLLFQIDLNEPIQFCPNNHKQ